MKLYIKSSHEEQEPVNQIYSFAEDDMYTTFFLYTEGSGYWYWTVDTPIVKEYQGADEEFVNDEANSQLGSSVAFFDTLEEAISDYLRNTDHYWIDVIEEELDAPYSEGEVISEFINIDGPVAEGTLQEMKSYLNKHHISECTDLGDKGGVLHKIAIININDPNFDSPQCVMYQTYDGKLEVWDDTYL